MGVRLHQDRVLLSATDLEAFLGCRHASRLDFREAILGESLQRSEAGASSELVRRRSLEHERRHFEALKAALARGEVVWLESRDTEEPGLSSVVAN